ncbi:MAG: EamA family transporter [Opitutales bacterium]
MIWLWATTLLWAFSFGLIKRHLSGIDPLWIAAVRLILAGLVFLPFVRLGGLPRRERLVLPAIGALQFGLMYVLYLQAFTWLPAYQVALFSLTTPLYVVAIASGFRREMLPGSVWTAGALAVVGALIIRFQGMPAWEGLTGILLMQGANLAFAAGQVAYAAWARSHPRIPQRSIMALLFLGGLGAVVLAAIPLGMDVHLPRQPAAWITLLYLGTVASGLGFFCWNRGAARVTPGQLAVMNNAVIPVAVLVSLLLFREAADFGLADWTRVLAGSSLLLVAGHLARPDAVNNRRGATTAG